MHANDGRFQVHTTEGELNIHPALTSDSLEADPAASRASWTYDPRRTRAELKNTTILGRRCTLDLTFDRNHLTLISIFIHLDADGSSWSDWTLAQEMARKRAHEQLALELFGTTLTPRVIMLDGKAIPRLFPDEQWPNAASFSWGEVVSSYDSKGGFSQLWIDLAAPPAPAPGPPRT